jgi:NADH-quinone oxidoreductase subunit C
VTHDDILKKLRGRPGCGGLQASTFRDNHRVVVPADRVHDALAFLKDECGFDLLVDLSAADYLRYPDATDRYGVWYLLTNTAENLRLVVKTWVNDPDPVLPSVYGLWAGADWMEREVYDMYGIVFDGHPDLRRILLPDEFTAFPLRKDYPMRGRGERHNFTPITRAEG